MISSALMIIKGLLASDIFILKLLDYKGLREKAFKPWGKAFMRVFKHFMTQHGL